MKNLFQVFFNIKSFKIIIIMMCFSAGAQEVNISEINKLFSDFNSSSTPGASITVVKDGKVVYENGFGVANLEYTVPITKKTIFHVASLSKQFTVFAILLLEKEGKLSLDDDIHKYLPNLPNFGKTITLRHLANHTSGLRDQWDLLTMSGVRLDDVITQSHVLKLIENQKELNFAPGEQNLYCNTGFTLLAKVVKKISGKSFSDFTRKQIFEPLGMENTQFYDNHEKIVPNRAYSYKNENKKFIKSTLSYSTVGPTSLFTTAEDFSAWAMNFNNPKVGDQSIFEKMNAPAILNNGDESIYFASGQFMGKYRDLFNYYHTGSDAGYKAYFIRIPEHKLSVAIFSNLASFNPGAVSLKVVDIILEDNLPARTPPKKSEIVKHHSSIFKKVSAKNLEKYTGNYWSEEFSDKRNVFIKNDTLIYSISEGNTKKLLPTDTNKFKMIGISSDIDVTFSKNKKEKKIMKLIVNKDRIVNYTLLTKPNLENYIGNYFSEELQTLYKLEIENNALILKHHRLDNIVLEPVSRKTFLSDIYFFSKLEFVITKRGKVIGFKANNGRVKNLWFKKQ